MVCDANNIEVSLKSTVPLSLTLFFAVNTDSESEKDSEQKGSSREASSGQLIFCSFVYLA